MNDAKYYFEFDDKKFDSNMDFIKQTTAKLNDTLDDWELVKVVANYEFPNDLTEVITYEYKYRFYLEKFYSLVGLDSPYPPRTYYWERNLDGTGSDCYLPGII